MNNLEKKLKSQIAEAVKNAFDLELDENSITIEIPKELQHGDYSTNAAMQLSRTLHKKAMPVRD